jgi:hypothetical protein
MRQSLEQNSEIPPEMRDTIMRLFTGRALWVLLLAFMIPVNAVFAMLGALLGLAFFRKKLPPVTPQG